MFGYAEEITEGYPAIRAGVIHATGVANGPSPPALIDDYRAEQRLAAARLEATPIADIASIGAWRRAFSRFGAKPTQYRSAPEALLRRLSKQGDLPAINTLVDAGNLVSIRYAVPVAAFDLANIAGAITVRLAAGDEAFSDLGSSATVSPDRGEVVFVDDDNVVCARRWCWRQSATSATGPKTSEALLVVEALHETADEDVQAASGDIVELMSAHQPQAQFTSYLLSPAAPSTESGERSNT